MKIKHVLKHIISILLLSILLFISCQSATSPIITSKKVAIKKNKYDYNLGNRITLIEKKMNEQKLYFAKKDKRKLEVIKIEPNKKIILDNGEEDIIISSSDASYLSEQLVNNASDNLGSRYKTGGISKGGFDCSGLMYATFKNFDIILPRVSTDMAKIGRVLQRNEIRKGDLIFFRTNGKKHINHVGMVLEAKGDDITFIHSSTKHGVIISNTKETYYGRTFAQVNRVIE